MEVSFWQLMFAIVVFLLGCLGTALRIGYVIASAISKIDKQMDENKAESLALIATMKAEFHALLELKEAESGKAVGRVYQRFDEYKTLLEASFVRREMCALTHGTTNDQFEEIKKTLHTNGEKLDALIVRVAGMR